MNYFRCVYINAEIKKITCRFEYKLTGYFNAFIY